MPIPSVTTLAVVYAKTGPTLLARVRGNDGAYLTQATVSSISYIVRDMDDPTVNIDAGSMTVASVIFNALQTGTIWVADDVGYNFKYAMNKNQLPRAGFYRVEVKIIPTVGEQFFLVFPLEAKEILT